MNDLQSISNGILAGMLAELARKKNPHSDIIEEAARRLRLMPSLKVATKVPTELLKNGSPTEIIEELTIEIAHLKRLLQGW
jgi:hypothetical protein